MNRILIALVTLLGATSFLNPASAKEVSATSTKITFDGTSTVRAFICGVKTADTKLNASEAGVRLDALSGAVTGATIKLQVADIDCKDNTMNEHMRKALQADQHPTITFALKGYEAGAVAGDKAPVKLAGELTIAGKTKPVVLTSTATVDGNQLKVRGDYTLNMTEYGVKPPTLMFGAIKVGEKVVLHFEVAVPQSAPATVGSKT